MFLIAELVASILFIALQWKITVDLLAMARRRLPGPVFQAVRIGVLVFNLALAVGYLMSDSELAAESGFPPRPAAFLGAGALIYLSIASGTMVLHWLFQFLDRRMAPKFDSSRRRALRTAGNAAMVVPAAVIGYGVFVERFNVRIREIDVPIPGLPQDLEGFRILQISDIHLSAFLSEKQLSRVIDTALEFRPHLAAITGDLISSAGDPLDACIRQVARLRADAGIFGCMGNHEIYAKAEDYAEKAGARAGIRFLRGTAIPLRFGTSTVNLAGVDYQRFARKNRYLRGAEKLVIPGAINVLMSHNPDVFPVAANQGYNFLLAGHTHGGQVTVEILEQSVNPARFFTRYVYGLYRAGGASAYVTRGVGTIGIPVRIGAPPEIVQLHFRKA